ncbi:tryptophan 2,3-dioxygenase [Glycocaulis alkaliphilus]|uniref:Tryptophan 2,3-dioxygenase n=1 Tax=Glycocaulis alkaliphilus TaxID=1434191 RepID=A0A3T0E9N1_9PROT|nr:tryptophan 2,3-dioxygenase [Glycocaulis alkaliphilus]AZU04155.1 tryptophan 2,3-dioxygenase [Glycocaulis alkaliphilus]GGB76285.1 tryptophan 2,3-dioxygenase [Glycocaulis alkaliphilus]
MSEHFPTSVNLEGEDIHWSPEGGLSYGRYLVLDRILGAQSPLTEEHDEMMFIIIHQASELWLKLCLHELEAAIAHVQADEVRPAMKMLARIARIQEQLTQSWAVLSTMTPSDYLKFRDQLGQSSGFQSAQYRTLEYRLGNKNAALAKVHASDEEAHTLVSKALVQPSLYDETLRFAARSGLTVPSTAIERDWSQPYQPDDAVEAMWREVYLDTGKWWEVYEFAEKLVDLEQKFQQWRFNHMKTVERIIGFRRGTGGSGGVSYLVKALNLRLFPELWTVRTTL